MFPPCKSPCTKLSRTIIFMLMSYRMEHRLVCISRFLCPSEDMASLHEALALSKSSRMLEITFPSAQVSTRTSGVANLGETFGKRMRCSPRKLRLNLCKLNASRVKSICALITSSNSPLLNGIVMWRNFSENSTTFQTMDKSMNALSTTPGCWTLTATSRSRPPGPSRANSGRRRARCTWPTEPLATGCSSNKSKSSSTSRPSCSRSVRRETSIGWLGASDRSLPRTWITSGGNMSGRMDNHWPNF
mmetsp:Transcript_125771/g.350441  ORF Transcript_125771/g.350441 Transcript_125771/m.350441 type:complete len:246 (-) Transcript_125771:40-777(-)